MSLKYEIPLLKKLVALNTDSETKENYWKCANLIAAEARRAGLKAGIIRAKAPDRKPRPNVVVELNKGAKETLLLVTHYDIVAAGSGWKTNPFRVTRKGNRLYGRGVNDDKAGIAVAIGAMKELKKEKVRRNIKLIAACDEEVGGDFGIKYLVKRHWKDITADVALILDASLNKVSIGCSGIPRGYIILNGKQGHAGYPFRTPNIIHNALPFLIELKDYKNIAEKQISSFNAPRYSPKKKMFGRFSITVLSAGYKSNVIPSQLKIGFDLRIIPEADAKREMNKFKQYVRKKMKKYGLKGRIEIKGTNGYFTDEQNPFVKELQDIAEKITGKRLRAIVSFGGEDGRHIAPKGIAIAGFGPGGKHPHSAKEFITARDLEITKEMIKELCRS